MTIEDFELELQRKLADILCYVERYGTFHPEMKEKFDFIHEYVSVTKRYVAMGFNVSKLDPWFQEKHYHHELKGD